MNNDLNNDLLMQKLNYMINLLEEQQDEKTNNVTEEVILYSFLGIFIIFIADSFAKVGKYVR
jgi:high-affinity K+ transport system ATPase subunit B